MKNSSGSALERDWNCPGNRALPSVQQTTEASTVGNDNHEKIEVGLTIGGDLSAQPIVVQRAMKDATAVTVEAAYALNVVTEEVRLIGYRLGRNYGQLDDNEIVCTVDAVIDVESDGFTETTVWDWKSRKRVTDAVRNLQLRCGCVAVLKHRGLSMVRGGIGYLDNGEEDTTIVDAFDVPMFFEDMRQMLNRIGAARLLATTGKVPDVHAGPWCEYCPAMPYCPAHNRLALQMMGELDFVEQRVAFMTAEDAGKAWTLVKRIQSLADRVEASIRLRAQSDVVPLPNGKRLALVESSRKSFDKDAAIKRLTDHGLPADDLYKTTKFNTVKEIKFK